MRSALRDAIAGSAVLAAVLVGCGDDESPALGGGTTPTPSPVSTTFTEAEWTIQTPAGWTREVDTVSDAKKAVKYKDSEGNYFTVAIDPLGSDYAYDVLWHYKVSGSRFEVIDRSQCTDPADDFCSIKDTRYAGYIIWPSGADAPKVGGHSWYFVFGNDTRTTVDAALFERILRSVVVR